MKWQVERVEEGVFDVVNVGHDPAFKVLVEMWTTMELESGTARKVAEGEHVRVRLPRRAAGQAEPTTVPASMFEGFPDDPPELNPLLGAAREKIMADWERGKKLKDQAMARQAELEKLERESQVQVRVVWRSKLGTWNEHTEKTG
ncbi:hypothetical protein [Actinomadura citrea]|uniref:Uncharacterized protein n=1 Tax=Actinomadura citrea TaxID=46158 RepID=A0A7Y9GDL7_9ACTN|nr:hypothetical protein [Actinomadura citrea]NYE13235.1 hypothetical protein [Actinomadura citrea]GGU04948.1 hypothetical protein GCM10010177_75380 [Actinomadura citrea]